VVWYGSNGKEMEDDSWRDPAAKVVGFLLRDGTSRLFFLVNAFHETISFKLPDVDIREDCRMLLDAGNGLVDPRDATVERGRAIDLEGRTLLVLAGEKPPAAG
jgi:pullulanase/glycogen debranching enzyme